MARKKQAPRWEFTYNDKHYVLDVGRDLTMSRLLHIKQWYPNLGTMNRMVVGLIEGDPEAWACAIWAARKSAGETEVTEPKRMRDFSIWELMADEDLDDEDEENDDESESEVEGDRPTRPPTLSGTSSSTASEDAISAS